MVRLRNALSIIRGLAAPQSRQLLIHVLRAVEEAPQHECPCCGYVGKFMPYYLGRPPAFNVECPSCHAFERHRLFAFTQKRHKILKGDERLLHFAPEPSLQAIVRPMVASYSSADLRPEAADLVLNIEAMDLPDASMDAAICSHVLEHVDDAKALAEFYRVLTPGGKLIIMVPVIEGWDTTYEDPKLTSEADRELHFGQYDHVRYYGRDFRKRVLSAGFELQEYAATGPETAKYGFLRGERIFVGVKPG